MTELLFSYGTLLLPEVQRATFGGELRTVADGLPGWRVEVLRITDPAVIALSGADQHPILVRTGDDTDVVEGGVLEVTTEQFRAADSYDVDDYARIAVTLASGRTAWVYVSS